MGYLFVSALLSAFLCGIYCTFWLKRATKKQTALSITTLILICPLMAVLIYIYAQCALPFLLACFCMVCLHNSTRSSHWVWCDPVLLQSVSILTSRGGVPQVHKLKYPPRGSRGLSNKGSCLLLITPGVCQNIALQAAAAPAPPDRTSTYVVSASSIHSTSFPTKTPLIININSEMCREQ